MFKFVCKICGRFFYATTSNVHNTICSGCGNDTFRITQESFTDTRVFEQKVEEQQK